MNFKNIFKKEKIIINKENFKNLYNKFNQLKDFLLGNKLHDLIIATKFNEKITINNIFNSLSNLFFKNEKLLLINNINKIKNSLLNENKNMKNLLKKPKITIKNFNNCRSVDIKKRNTIETKNLNSSFNYKNVDTTSFIPIKKLDFELEKSLESNLQLNSIKNLNNTNEIKESIVYKNKIFKYDLIN